MGAGSYAVKVFRGDWERKPGSLHSPPLATARYVAGQAPTSGPEPEPWAAAGSSRDHLRDDPLAILDRVQWRVEAHRVVAQAAVNDILLPVLGPEVIVTAAA